MHRCKAIRGPCTGAKLLRSSTAALCTGATLTKLSGLFKSAKDFSHFFKKQPYVPCGILFSAVSVIISVRIR